MKNAIITGIITASFLLAGCGKKSGASGSSVYADQERAIAESQVIGYASTDTNSFPDIVLTVTEIWKGSHEASALGITNGTQFSIRWPADGGTLPDGAVVTIPRMASPTLALQGQGELFVRSGQVLGMSIQKFKTRFGL